MKIRELSGAPGVWRFFDMICATPHPSGHEGKLAELLTDEARRAGLQVRSDSFGNMRIDRAPSPGFEQKPAILLQAHLDMVPQKRPGSTFDFTASPLPVRVEGNRIHCGGETTLGADDGIGVALALDALTDKDLKCGPLAAVFTREEEIGLNGARALDPAFLAGSYLINLDSGDDSCFCAGCAGGVEDFGFFTPEYRTPPAGVSVKITVENLRGGHSGAEIHNRRGNAHKFLAAFLQSLGTQIALASLEGGSVVNAISRESAAVGVSKLPAEQLREKARIFAEKIAETFDAPPGFGFAVTPCAAPDKVWSEKFQAEFLEMLESIPDGVLEFSEELDAVATSCNLGVIRLLEDGRIKVGVHPRSFRDAQWQKISADNCALFRRFGGSAEERAPYAGWQFKADSPLLSVARAVYRKVYGKEAPVQAIHAGLEPGLFSGMAPKLEMISFSPASGNEHTPEEFLEIESTIAVACWLRELIKNL